MGSLGNVQSALAAEVEAMRARSAAQEDDYCDTIAELQAQVLRRRLQYGTSPCMNVSSCSDPRRFRGCWVPRR